MDRMTLLKKLDEAGATGLDMSPGDPLARQAATLIRDQALGRDAVLELGQYVNDADIGGFDSPHQVVTKLQAAIDRALKREPSADPGGGIQPVDSESVPAPERMDRTSVTSANHAATTIPAVPVSAPYVASMVKELADSIVLKMGWTLVDYGELHNLITTEAAALLARLGQGWVPVSLNMTNYPVAKHLGEWDTIDRKREDGQIFRFRLPPLPLSPGASDE